MKKVNNKTKFNNVNVSIKHGKEKPLKLNSVKEYSKNDKLSKYEAKKQKNQARKEKFIKGAKYIGSHGGNFLSLLIIILIGVAMIRILYNGSADTVNLGSFLDMLSNAPQVSNSVKTFVQGIDIAGPWLVLDELRVVLNSLIDVFAILVWMASSLVDVIFFIGFFLYWIFI